MKLEDKVVLITGAAKRIGREIALTLARSGAHILIHYHTSRQDALDLKKQIESLNVEASLFPFDFSCPTKPLVPAIRKFVNQIYRKIPHVDILVNNASIFYPTPLGKIKEEEWDDFMTVNLKAPFFLSQEIGQRMFRRKSGKIINLVDWTVNRPHPDYLAYTISKAGLAAATVGLARAFAPYVQVNSIAPGPILPSRGLSKKDRNAVAQKTLLKRFGHPSDIAETVRFLAEGTDFITGALIPVDGGSHIA